MKDSGEGGFFLWEALLVGMFLLVMAGAAGIYVKATELKNISSGQAAAIYLARAQISYAQSSLDQNGMLPSERPYLGATEDLDQNDIVYQVDSVCSKEGERWQLRVEIVWEVQGHEKKLDFTRTLAQHMPSGPKGDGPL